MGADGAHLLVASFARSARKGPSIRSPCPGNSAAGFASRGYDKAMQTQLDVGILDYCGVAERRVELLFGSIEGQSCADQILLDAERLASEF